MNKLLTLGHGYCANTLAQTLIAKGWQVYATYRNPDQAAAIEAIGATPVLFDANTLTPVWHEATHILASAAPVGGKDPFLAALPALRTAPAQWVGYLSTTGVYGDRQGAWVDEDTPPAPIRGRSGDRVEAETEWLTSGLPAHVFRLSGIYGPGRGPFQRVKDGTAKRIIKEGQLFSRIHVEDIAQVLEASIAQPNPGRIYNLCDDEPAPSDVVLSYAAHLLDLPPPPATMFDDANLPPMARSFYEESRRVRNNRIKEELGVTLRYPTYRQGLEAILRAEG